MIYTLITKLISDTTFARGDGLAGAYDVEVEHNVETGLPCIHGRTLKGLLSEACADLLYAFQCCCNKSAFDSSAERIFGNPGSTYNSDGIMHISTGQFPEDLQRAVGYAVANGDVRVDEVLDSLTSSREQTSISNDGIPEENSLRSVRAVIRGMSFFSAVDFSEKPTNNEILLLNACASVVRRGGLGRNRGRGRLSMQLVNNSDTPVYADGDNGERDL